MSLADSRRLLDVQIPDCVYEEICSDLWKAARMPGATLYVRPGSVCSGRQGPACGLSCATRKLIPSMEEFRLPSLAVAVSIRKKSTYGKVRKVLTCKWLRERHLNSTRS